MGTLEESGKKIKQEYQGHSGDNDGFYNVADRRKVEEEVRKKR